MDASVPAARRRRLGLALYAACLGSAVAAPPPAAPPAPAAEAAFDDGPYIRYAEGAVIARWVCAGKVLERRYPAARWPVRVPPRCGFERPILVRAPAQPQADAADAPVARIAALSDVHGQYDLLVRLLQAHGIVGRDLRWRYGRGHLVVVGDVFDRGPKVNQALWLLYSLEQQARDAGGGVHYLIGNHEAMALGGDLRYVNPGYQRSAAALGETYPQLYGPDSVLGQWLRTRQAIARVGGMLFVHGGISPDYLAGDVDTERSNAAYRASLGTPKAVWQDDPQLSPLYNGKTSPIWYRGYFTDPALQREQVDAIAARLGVSRIVVGHTTHHHIASYFDGRVIGVDSGLKNGESGEILLVEDGEPTRGALDGGRLPLLPGERLKDED
ncbi:Calcineurin-like phosphoesterase [Lysobacter sp. yr284]|uniref:metallophosphoesterase n=1 Tax=Lysobacter sp. yr284 TaxID=1761791 RepID=UPI0008981749|nr:metallophosphoesterase [Lysobacter sp. yr284]SDZ01921.1 Calcineurin-like phosphoesterase [Lysobacter sp. yr284]